jgi:hypothetical protein
MDIVHLKLKLLQKEKKMENNKNALIPVIKALTEHPFNFVKYKNTKGGSSIVFCETVSSFNGYIVMMNVRTKTSQEATIEPITQVLCQHSGLDTDRANKSSFYENGYTVMASKLIPEVSLIRIDSYGYDDGLKLVDWTQTTAEEAINKANEIVQAYNEKVLKHNCEIFSNIVDAHIEGHFYKEYYKLPWYIKNFNMKSTWVKKQKKLPEYQKLLEGKISSVKSQYQKAEFQYEGELIYAVN